MPFNLLPILILFIIVPLLQAADPTFCVCGPSPSSGGTCKARYPQAANCLQACRLWLGSPLFNGTVSERPDMGCRDISTTPIGPKLTLLLSANGRAMSSLLTVNSPEIGYFDSSRALIDMNADGKADFCRIEGGPGSGGFKIRCSMSTGNGFDETESAVLKKVVHPNPNDAGYDTTRGFADINGDGKQDFCRVEGNHGDYKLRCTLGPEFTTSTEPSYLDFGNRASRGYNRSESWVDVNGDGFSEFCRTEPLRPGHSLVCDKPNFTVGQSRSTQHPLLVVEDPANIGPRSKFLFPNGTGEKAANCRVEGQAGTFTIRCQVASAAGSFADLKVSGHSISNVSGYNFSHGWIDVTGDGKPDYCRVEGTEGNLQIHCQKGLGNGTFEPTASVISVGMENSPRFYHLNGSGIVETVLYGDINGDGLGDAVVIWRGR